MTVIKKYPLRWCGVQDDIFYIYKYLLLALLLEIYVFIILKSDCLSGFHNYSSENMERFAKKLTAVIQIDPKMSHKNLKI